MATVTYQNGQSARAPFYWKMKEFIPFGQWCCESGPQLRRGDEVGTRFGSQLLASVCPPMPSSWALELGPPVPIYNGTATAQ